MTGLAKWYVSRDTRLDFKPKPTFQFQVEAVAHQILDNLMQENIWEPLSAISSTFYPSKHFSHDPIPPQQEMAHPTEQKGISLDLVHGPKSPATVSAALVFIALQMTS